MTKHSAQSKRGTVIAVRKVCRFTVRVFNDAIVPFATLMRRNNENGNNHEANLKLKLQPTGKWGIASPYRAIFCRSASSFTSNPQRDCQTPAGLEHRLAAATAGDETKDGRHQSQTHLSTPHPHGPAIETWEREMLSVQSVACLVFPKRLPWLSSASSQLRVERVQRSQGAVIVAGQRYGTGPGKVGDRNVCLADYQENKPADVIVVLLCPMPSPVPGAILERANTLPPAPPQGITDQTPGTGETSPFCSSLCLEIRLRLSAVHRGPSRQHWLS